MIYQLGMGLFSQKEGVMIWIVVTPQMLHIEILIPKLTVSADESLGRWLDHKVGILSFQSGTMCLLGYTSYGEGQRKKVPSLKLQSKLPSRHWIYWYLDLFPSLQDNEKNEFLLLYYLTNLWHFVIDRWVSHWANPMSFTCHCNGLLAILQF